MRRFSCFFGNDYLDFFSQGDGKADILGLGGKSWREINIVVEKTISNYGDGNWDFFVDRF